MPRFSGTKPVANSDVNGDLGCRLAWQTALLQFSQGGNGAGSKLLSFTEKNARRAFGQKLLDAKYPRLKKERSLPWRVVADL